MTSTVKQGRTAIWLIVLAASGAGMYYWGRHTAAEAPAAPNAAAADTGAQTAAQRVGGAGASGPAASIPRYTTGAARPLPSVDTPLRLILPELQRRAANEPAAACRLAAEMEYCDSLRQRLAGAESGVDNFERQLERMPQDTPQQREQRKRMADSYQNMTDKLLTQSEHCADVPTLSAEQRAGYWRRAALAGHPAAMRHYASGNAFRQQQLLDSLPALATYRGEAESIARTAAMRGDARMLASLAYAYSPRRDSMRRNFLGQAVKSDPVESLSLFLQLLDSLPPTQPDAAPAGPRPGFGRSPSSQREMVEAQIRALTRDLPPDQANRARERASERAQSWSRAGVPRAPAAGGESGASDMTPFLLQGFVPDVQRQECDPT
ncbi:hypothetical protein [Lysobacter gummosus]|uniref:Secreted protein n=1 Tax=Lysobacter gummosus TaxID=262324 RepID=A0ABY3XIW7_9GAMM|nr:hypothetical protein [Lysobacter gummosus]ALN91198.1 hypothetical protein LG3211_2231 [Lysobacter gummosus]UNP31608.1 hypothetical protein MOV92_10325 [Lysobacter gummosus]